MTRVRSTHLEVAQYCPGSPSLQRSVGRRGEGEPPAAGEPIRRGLVGHAFLEIALSVGWGAAARWLAEDPAVEAALPELLDPELQPWIEQEVLEGRRGETEVGVALLVLPSGVVSMRLDWVAGDIAAEEGTQLVVDWKFGAGWFLPPIIEDLQMIAYGVKALEWSGSADHRQARVKRVLVSERKVEDICITPEVAEEVRPWLEEIVHGAAYHPDSRRPGLWCQRCWARSACPERLALVTPTMDALVLRTPDLGRLSKREAQLWAEARAAIRERCDQLDQALVAYLDEGGEVVSDGQRLKVSRFYREKVTVPADRVLSMVAWMAGGWGAQALRTSKGALVEAAKKAGLGLDEIEAKLQALRDQGLLERTPVEQLTWVKRRVIDVDEV